MKAEISQGVENIYNKNIQCRAIFRQSFRQRYYLFRYQTNILEDFLWERQKKTDYSRSWKPWSCQIIGFIQMFPR